MSRAFIVIFIYYLVVVSRAAPEYARAMARAANSTNPVQIARALAGPWAVQFIRAAAGSFGRPPESVLKLARGEKEKHESRPVLTPGDSSSGGGSAIGSIVGSLAPALAGVAGSAFAGPIGGAAAAAAARGLATRAQEQLSRRAANRGQCHREFAGGPFSADQQQKYGANNVPSSNIGHLRVGNCSAAQGARNLCVALEPNAIRVGNDYVVARYPRRLANTLASKYRDQNGNLTENGARVLASAYVNTIRALQDVPRNPAAFFEKFGYYPPDDCEFVPPHEYTIEGQAKADWIYGAPGHFLRQGEAVHVSWLTRQRLLMNQALEFLEQLQRELHDEKPIPQDALLAVSRIGYKPVGEYSLRATENNPPRLIIESRNATNFLPPRQ